MRVVWTAEARDCLKRIRAHIEQDNPKAARAMIERILAREGQLQRAPSSGRRVPEYPETDLRELLERPYRIIYRATSERVEVLSVMHYRRLLPTDELG